MRYLLAIILFILSFSRVNASQKENTFSSVEVAFHKLESPQQKDQPKEKKFDLKDPKTLSIIALAASASGVLLIALPYLSLLGLVLGLGGLVLGWMMRKRAKKKIWAKLAIILGALCLVFFLATLALVIFV